MKKLWDAFSFAICVLAVVFSGPAFASECTGWSYYDSSLESCITCENSGFAITTTNLPANLEFWFSMSPKGSFAVDWALVSVIWFHYLLSVESFLAKITNDTVITKSNGALTASLQ